MNDTEFVALLQRLFGRYWHRFAEAFNALRRHGK
jgi:hypothetical protein